MPMPGSWLTRWSIVWATLCVAIGSLVVRADITSRREAFQADARTAHRLLSQRAAQHDAILATLVLLDPMPMAEHPSARLPALYPQVLKVWRRTADATWPDALLATAENQSRAAARPALAGVDAASGYYDLVLAGTPASFALRIELDRWVPWQDWPFDRDGAVKADLAHGSQRLQLQPGLPASGWHGGVTPGFVFAKVLGTPSQAFVLHLQRATGPADWPWARLMAMALAMALLTAAAAALQRQRQRRHRAEQLLRLARTARLNALGELAAGVAHELNQPLTALMASTQAARRLLDDQPLPLATLHEALGHARDQARRAADVVARLRRLVEKPGDAGSAQPVRLGDVVRGALGLLQPELRRLGLQPELKDTGASVTADPVALEQILHNLLNNALQAMESVPTAQRQLRVTITTQGNRGVLCVLDGGTGLAPEVLAQLFQPFTSTKAGGLGLGLSLCESLAGAMGGSLTAQNVQPHGAEFKLELPLAPTR